MVLGGCLRYQVDLSVSTDQRVSGTVVFAIRTSGSNVVRANTEIPSDLTDRVSVQPYEQDGYLGERLSLDRLTFEQAGRLFDQVGPLIDQANRTRSRTPTGSATPTAPASPTVAPTGTAPVRATDGTGSPGDSGQRNQSTITFTRDGDLLRVGGVTSFPLFASTGNEQNFDVRIALTFPGDIVSTNGDRHDRTVSWVVSPDRPTQISVVARLSDTAPAMARWLLVGGGGLAAVLVAVLVTALVRRRRAAVPVGAAPVFDAAEFQTFLDDRSWHPPVAPSGPPPPPAQPPYPGPGQPGPGQYGQPAWPPGPGPQGPPGPPGQPHWPGPSGGTGASGTSGTSNTSGAPDQSGWPPPYPESPHH